MEQLKVFDENYTYVKDEGRDAIHREGLWHETFHCWLVDEQFVYIQKRSAVKKDFPNLFDITAAGHILATETIEEGVREVEEELGIAVDFSKLHAKGVVRDRIELPDFHDYEYANVFLYESTFLPSDFSLQREEVESVHIVKREDFVQLSLNKIKTVTCTNIFDATSVEIGLIDFVPHEHTYFKEIARIVK